MQRLIAAIKELEKAIGAADAMGCYVSPEDRALLGLTPPTCPAN